MAAALELARRGIRARIIDRNPAPAKSSRGIGIHPRTLELLSLHGLADAFLEVGLPQSGLYFYEGEEEVASVDFTLAPSPYQTIAVAQAESERIFRSAIQRSGLSVEWGVELIDLDMTGDGAIAHIRNQDGSEERLQTNWVIGCDGARSTVRGLIGAVFEGDSYPEAWGLVDCKAQWDMGGDSVRVYRDPHGRQLVVIPLGGDRYRLQIDQRADAIANEPPTVGEMQQEIKQRTGLEAKITEIEWASPYRLHRRIADRYSHDRVFIAGDAAHIHSPYGAQGLNTGIQDGINIGWKLSLVATGLAAPSLLDSYVSERRPIAIKVIELSHALMRNTREIAGAPERRKDIAAIVSGCAANYRDSALSRKGTEWPLEALLPGDRIPDLPVHDSKGLKSTLYELLRPGLPTVVLLTGDGHPALEGRFTAALQTRWGESVRIIIVDESEVANIGDPLLHLSDKACTFRTMLGLQARTAAAIVIRPDAYLGFATCGALTEEVSTYLSEVMRLI